MRKEADHEGCWGEQLVQAAVEVGVLQAVLGHEGEDAVQGQHAHEAARAQGSEQEVRQQQGARHVGDDARVHPHQHLAAATQAFSVSPCCSL